jgi:hypothetical protein
MPKTSPKYRDPEVEIPKVEIIAQARMIAVPARHFSGRADSGLVDPDQNAGHSRVMLGYNDGVVSVGLRSDRSKPAKWWSG